MSHAYLYLCLFDLLLYISVNSYGHVGTFLDFIGPTKYGSMQTKNFHLNS